MENVAVDFVNLHAILIHVRIKSSLKEMQSHCPIDQILLFMDD